MELLYDDVIYGQDNENIPLEQGDNESQYLGEIDDAETGENEFEETEFEETDEISELDDIDEMTHIDLDDLGIFESGTDTDYLDSLFWEDEYQYAQFQEARRLMAIQAAAVEIYGVLMEHFFTDVDGSLELVYPDNYAGAFVLYDTLVIQLTDTSDEAKAFYWDLLGYDAPIAFELVDFSINQLTAFGEVFMYAIDAPIVGFGYDTMNNSFRIALDENSPASVQTINSFNQTARFLPLPINLELEEPFETFSLVGGTELTFIGSNPFSIGLSGTIRATGQLGLLTTGHAFVGRQRGLPVRSNGFEIGQLFTYRVGGRWGGEMQSGSINGDWGIIRLHATNNTGITNQVRTGARMHASGDAPVGAIVLGTGLRTLSFQGRVSHVNQSRWYNARGVDIFGLTRVSRLGSSSPVDGDSGGPIWINNPSFNTFVGVVAGGSPSNWYFSPFSWARPYFLPHLSDWTW